MTITPQIFEAYLKCPTKCWLRAVGEHTSRNTYADWLQTQTASYRVAESKRFIAQIPSGEYVTSPCSDRDGGVYTSTEDLKAAKWRLAIDVPLHADESKQARNVRPPSSEAGGRNIITTASTKQESTPQMMLDIEARLHMIERIPSAGRGKSAKFIPIRFAYQNKLNNDERMMLAFDVLVLSEVLGRPIGLGKIIHGEDQTTLKVKTSGTATQVKNHIKKIITLMSSHSPPDISLNRHCAECEFQDHCRKIATEKDDLSLLSNMSEKERQKLRAKGIFTVTQLSYTFRPRRRAKNQNDRPEKYHHSLKALAIREKKIHVIGYPELKIEGTPVYMDVEGLPDRDFYYLIGMRIGQSGIQHSLWVNEIDGELQIWNDFLGILASIENPVLIHYGSYETTFFTRMQERYGKVQNSHPEVALVLDQAINLVSIIYAKVYFPTYSNGLKYIAKCIGFTWGAPDASGLNSIVWRSQWEMSKSVDQKSILVNYNADDCAALAAVAEHVHLILSQPREIAGIVRADDLPRFKGVFKLIHFNLPEFEEINRAAYWDYQREHILVKSTSLKPPLRLKKKEKWTVLPANKIINLAAPLTCVKCGNSKVYKHQTGKKIVIDIRYGAAGIRRWVTSYCYYYHRCVACGAVFRNPKVDRIGVRYGLGLRAFCVYQNIDLRISQGRVASFLSQVLSIPLHRSQVHIFKSDAAKMYRTTYEALKDLIVSGSLIHADETQINIRGVVGYVWVFTNIENVIYIYSSSREGSMVRQFLKNFTGVLVTDFYAAYEALNCPQQKCLIHLIRDLNEELFREPFNEEFKRLVVEFAFLLRPMIATIDRFGLKSRYMRKHKHEVNKFFKRLANCHFTSEAAVKCKQRLERNSKTLFTFLDYDNVPWNNNNAEHAVKAFALLRRDFEGLSTEKGIEEYLILLSVCETCRFKGVNFLDFLRSGELNIDQFTARRQSRFRAGATLGVP